MTVLVVAAHPDDEILGAGGFTFMATRAGVATHCLLLSGDVEARHNRPDIAALHADIEAAAAVVGFESTTLGPFPNIGFNTQRHLDLVRFIEDAIKRTDADTLITHHPSDVNDDHRHTTLATMAAARLHQRGHGGSPLKQLLFMEVLSSTDWAFPGVGPPFEPTAFVEMGEEGVTAKIRALTAYRGVTRDFPHPRSPEVIRGLAATRGAMAGMHYAEAFQVGFSALEPGR